MTQLAPSGYITMKAGDIIVAAKAYIDAVKATQKAWDAELPKLLAAWVSSWNWWQRLWYHTYGCWPRATETEALVNRYTGTFWDPDKPDVPGLKQNRPEVRGVALEWLHIASNLSPTTNVLIDAEDAAFLMPWLHKTLPDVPQSPDPAANE
jgi:hypothetical protein